MPMRLPLLVVCSGALVPLAASDALIEPGERLAVMDTPHIHALVPADEVEALRPFIARADVIYVAMAKDAGYTITKPINLLLDDDLDDHNGYSFVTPFPLIDIQLAPSVQSSGIFTGNGVLERTLTHELTHHLSNDREPNKFRHAMEEIFGRILPNDLLSDVVAYLSIPAHEFSPSFWHEGCAQWAETVYSPNGSVWGGRGRDSLTHMVWRLDAAQHAIPPVGEWRSSYQYWPFGNRVYLYGIAYLRYLQGAYGNRATVWQLIESQEHRWPFLFNGGVEKPLGASHAQLLAEARAALDAEQQVVLDQLRTQPITVTRRLTRKDGVVSAPAWTSDGRLFAAFGDIYGLPGFVRVDADGRDSSAGFSSYAMGDARSLPDGTLVFAETPAGDYYYRSSRISLVCPSGHRVTLDPLRTLEPDVRRLGDGIDRSHYQVASIQLLPASRQRLMLMDVAVDDGLFFAGSDCSVPTTWPTEGIPWSPSFRPKHDQLSWVETDADGSRLLLAPLGPHGQAQDKVPRMVLAKVRGRIMHPAWSADGAYVYLCADHSGVANAYRIDVSKPGDLVPVTNVVGGVIACVPSPDGAELALVDFDRRGPYLARMPNDPARWPKTVPTISLAWPAPMPGSATAVPAPGLANAANQAQPAQKPGLPAGPGFTPALPADQGDPAAITVSEYHGLGELRPLFWTPTTLAVPEGGYGITGVIADPIFTHELVSGVGAGPFKGSPVGFAGYVYGGQDIEVATLAWQAERNFNNQIVDTTGREYDYTEDRRSAELRLGLGLEGYARRYQAYVTAGIADYQPVHAESKTYQGQTLVNLAPFQGIEEYTEATFAYGDDMFFPTSYSPENGTSFALDFRHSGYGGDLHGERLIGLGAYVFSLWPEYGQELVLGGALGWSTGDRYLQGQFSVGGVYNINQLPRGYLTTQAVGDYLAGGSIAYRTPLRRAFYGFGSAPFVDRQEVLELFFDAAKTSTDRIDGNGSWFRSVGAELHLDMMFWEAQLDPGIGVARQLDGDRKWSVLFQLAFVW